MMCWTWSGQVFSYILKAKTITTYDVIFTTNPDHLTYKVAFLLWGHGALQRGIHFPFAYRFCGGSRGDGGVFYAVNSL